MKKAVAYLFPYIEAEKEEGQSAGKILLATVKGDVHDIGKNIVGVVLGCNNYEVIDMGVMIPCEQILATAKKENVDIIGLSGLITPSLDEMVYVAKEMEREGMDIPLLIGGATTSKVHTAVKIEQHYSSPTVHVLDASRSVPVVGKLLSDGKSSFVDTTQKDYQRLRDMHAKRTGQKEFLSIEAANNNKLDIDFSVEKPFKPNFLGTRVYDNFDINEIVAYIDWTPFFRTWELAGKYPDILTDSVVGEEAQRLFDDANSMLKKIINEKWLTAKGVIGLWEANTVNDNSIEIYDNEKCIATFHHLRQQSKKTKEAPNISLADFVAPKDLGAKDYMGGFAVTAGLGIEPHIKQFEADHDDYNAILLKALADRLAEAFAELMHQKVRKELWGYGAQESFTNEELIREKYKGIRPAPGYPACPDHTLKIELFNALNATATTGIELTDNLAMYPAASVSGFYFGNAKAKYFGLGKIAKDQVEQYSKTKNISLEEAEKWLSASLGY